MKQSEIAKQLDYSTSTLERCRNDINMLSPYRIHPNNTNKRKKKVKILNLTTIHIVILTSNDLKMTSNETIKNKKNKLKGGAINEINEHYIDEILQINNA